MLWHVCRRPGLRSQQRQPLIGNSSAKRPLLGNGTIKTDSIMEHATPPMEVPRETAFSILSAPTVTQATTEELLKEAISVLSIPRLYIEERRGRLSGSTL